MTPRVLSTFLIITIICTFYNLGNCAPAPSGWNQKRETTGERPPGVQSSPSDPQDLGEPDKDDLTSETKDSNLSLVGDMPIEPGQEVPLKETKKLDVKGDTGVADAQDEPANEKEDDGREEKLENPADISEDPDMEESPDKPESTEKDESKGNLETPDVLQEAPPSNSAVDSKSSSNDEPEEPGVAIDEEVKLDVGEKSESPEDSALPEGPKNKDSKLDSDMMKESNDESKDPGGVKDEKDQLDTWDNSENPKDEGQLDTKLESEQPPISDETSEIVGDTKNQNDGVDDANDESKDPGGAKDEEEKLDMKDNSENPKDEAQMETKLKSEQPLISDETSEKAGQPKNQIDEVDDAVSNPADSFSSKTSSSSEKMHQEGEESDPQQISNKGKNMEAVEVVNANTVTQDIDEEVGAKSNTSAVDDDNKKTENNLSPLADLSEKESTASPQHSMATSKSASQPTGKIPITTRSTSESTGNKASRPTYNQQTTAQIYPYHPAYSSWPLTQRLSTVPNGPQPPITHPSQYNPIYTTGNYVTGRMLTSQKTKPLPDVITTNRSEIEPMAMSENDQLTTSVEKSVPETTTGLNVVTSTSLIMEKAGEDIVETTTASVPTTTEILKEETTLPQIEEGHTTKSFVLSESTAASTKAVDDLESITTSTAVVTVNESALGDVDLHHNRKRPPVDYGREGGSSKSDKTPEKETHATKPTTVITTTISEGMVSTSTKASPVDTTSRHTSLGEKIKEYGQDFVKRYGPMKVSLILLALIALSFVSIVCCCKLCRRKGYRMHQRRLKEFGQEKEFLLRDRNKASNYNKDTVTLLEGSSEDEF